MLQIRVICQFGFLQDHLLHFSRCHDRTFAFADEFIIKISRNGTVLVNISYTETNCQGIFHFRRTDIFRHGVTHTIYRQNFNSFCIGCLALLNISCCIFSGCSGFLGNIIHQVMHMQHVAAGKYAVDIGFQTVIDNRSGCNRA